MYFLLNLKEPNSDLVPMSDRSQRLVTPVGNIQHPLLTSLNTHSHIYTETHAHIHINKTFFKEWGNGWKRI